MPALSPTMTEGKIARWIKSEGDKVQAGDVLAEIETDKATMEVEAVDEGMLARIVIPEGTDHVAVNTPIAVIAAKARMSTTPPKPPRRSRAARAPEPAREAPAEHKSRQPAPRRRAPHRRRAAGEPNTPARP